MSGWTIPSCLARPISCLTFTKLLCMASVSPLSVPLALFGPHGALSPSSLLPPIPFPLPHLLPQAVGMANCHFQLSGLPTYHCTPHMTVEECTRGSILLASPIKFTCIRTQRLEFGCSPHFLDETRLIEKAILSRRGQTGWGLLLSLRYTCGGVLVSDPCNQLQGAGQKWPHLRGFFWLPPQKEMAKKKTCGGLGKH